MAGTTGLRRLYPFCTYDILVALLKSPNKGFHNYSPLTDGETEALRGELSHIRGTDKKMRGGDVNPSSLTPMPNPKGNSREQMPAAWEGFLEEADWRSQEWARVGPHGKPH